MTAELSSALPNIGGNASLFLTNKFNLIIGIYCGLEKLLGAFLLGNQVIINRRLHY